MTQSNRLFRIDPEKVGTIIVVVMVVLFVIAMWLPSSPAWELIPHRDSDIFLYLGWRVLEGDIVYRDVWFHGPPMMAFVNALGLLIGGGSWWGLWLLDVAAISLAATLSILLLRRSFGLLPAVFGTAAWLLALLLFETWTKGNRIEGFALPLEFLALYLFVLTEKRNRHPWSYLAIGVLGGISFWLKPNLIGTWVAIGLYLMISRSFARRWRDLARDLSFIALGGLGVLLAVGIYLIAHNIVGEFWYAVFEYNLCYRSVSQASSPLDAALFTVRAGWELILSSGLPLYASAGWASGVALIATRRGEAPAMSPAAKMLLRVALIVLPLQILNTIIAGKGFDHYYLTWLPVMGVLAGYLAWLLAGHYPVQLRIGSLFRPRISLSNLGLLTLLLASGVFSVGDLVYRDLLFLLNPQREIVQQQVVDYILDNSAENDTVLVWGTDPGYNFLTRRESPTRFFFQLPLLGHGCDVPAFVAELVNDVKEASPRLIVDASNNISSMPPLTRDATSAEVRSLVDFIYSDYELVHMMEVHWWQEPWPIYRYVGGR